MECRITPLLAAWLACLLLVGCEPADKEANKVAVETVPEPATDIAAEATAILWQQGNSALGNCIAQTNALADSVDALLANPTQETLLHAQQNWLATAPVYQSFYFFSQFRIAEPQVFAALSKLWFAINAHPIQPGYLDYFGAYAYSGLVYDIGIPLDAETLRSQHGMTDAEDVVLGLYAIEFMLFGEAGARPASDYAEVRELTLEHQQAGYKTPVETPNNRRRELLALQMQLLAADVKQLQQAWTANTPGSMQQQWRDLPASNKRMITMKTIERSLTQLMLSTASASPEKHKANGSSNDNAAIEATRIARAIESLNAAMPWLGEATRTPLQAQLQTAREALDSFADGSAETPDPWRQAYQALKAAMDIFTGVT